VCKLKIFVQRSNLSVIIYREDLRSTYLKFGNYCDDHLSKSFFFKEKCLVQITEISRMLDIC